MRRTVSILAVMPFLSPAEIIDRVAVSVENAVISESEILRQVRLTAFLNDEPVAFTSERKRETADRLVEQMLIRREIATTRYLSDDPNAYQPAYESVRKNAGSDVAWRAKLEKYGISDSDVREALHWQTTLLGFIQIRFRPGIQVPENDVRVYYEAEYFFYRKEH